MTKNIKIKKIALIINKIIINKKFKKKKLIIPKTLNITIIYIIIKKINIVNNIA